MTIGGGERTVLSSRALASGSRPFSTTGNGSNDSKRRGERRANTVQNDKKSCAKSQKNTKKTAEKAVGKNKLSQKVYFLRERKSGGNFVLPARF